MNTISGKQLFSWYQQVQQQAKNNPSNIQEIDLLLSEFTDIDNLALKLKTYQSKDNINLKISWQELENLWISRIKNRCPIQYLIGKSYWRNFELKVSPSVLIPRPETELMIDIAQDIVQKNFYLADGNLLDLGTGSGAIAIGLADVFTNSIIYAIDRSAEALHIAQVNARKYSFESRIKFALGSWFEPIKEQTKSFSMIISNPPYIPSQLVTQLQPEVVNHEPRIALDGGEDGLDDIRLIINQSPKYLIDRGFILLEIMAGQSQQVKQLFIDNRNYTNIEIIPDLTSRERFAIAQLHSTDS